MNAWGSYVFIFYAALDIIMAVIVFFFVKETKGKSLEEMESLFNSRAAFDVDAVRRVVPDVPTRIELLEAPPDLIAAILGAKQDDAACRHDVAAQDRVLEQHPGLALDQL